MVAVWDPSSTPFITSNKGGNTVNIPSMFFSWKGHSLDFKIPLLRSERALNDEGLRLLNILGLKDHKFLRSDCGAEQVRCTVRHPAIAACVVVPRCGGVPRRPWRWQCATGACGGFGTPDDSWVLRPLCRCRCWQVFRCPLPSL